MMAYGAWSGSISFFSPEDRYLTNPTVVQCYDKLHIGLKRDLRTNPTVVQCDDKDILQECGGVLMLSLCIIV